MTPSLLFRLSVWALACGSTLASAQYPGWQQAINYDMEVVLDTATHRYDGNMTVKYTNNSPRRWTSCFGTRSSTRFSQAA